MAMMSLLEIVQRTAKRLSLPVPSSAYSSTDPTWMQGVEILTDLGEEISELGEWSYQITPATIAVATLNYHIETLPSDYSNMTEDGKIYRTMTFQPLIGPVTSSEWERLTIFGGGFIPGAWRLFNNTLNIYGVAVGETLKYEYISEKWITDSTGVTKKSAWTADTDKPLIDDQLLRTGLQWKWKRAKGFDYSEEKETYETLLESLQATNRGLRTVMAAYPLRGDDLQDGTWPGVVVP